MEGGGRAAYGTKAESDAGSQSRGRLQGRRWYDCMDAEGRGNSDRELRLEQAVEHPTMVAKHYKFI